MVRRRARCVHFRQRAATWECMKLSWRMGTAENTRILSTWSRNFSRQYNDSQICEVTDCKFHVSEINHISVLRMKETENSIGMCCFAWKYAHSFFVSFCAKILNWAQFAIAVQCNSVNQAWRWRHSSKKRCASFVCDSVATVQRDFHWE